MRIACVICCLLLLAMFAPAADTKPVKNTGGECVISVPANWSSGSFGDAQSPDKKMSLVISSPKHGLNTLEQVKQLAPTIYKDDKVTKSSGGEFEMAGQSQNGKPNVYRAIPAGAKVCIVELIYENGDDSGAKAIVESMKMAK
jgi:hypothetical protein